MTEPIPLAALRREFRKFLREQGTDPDEVEFEVSHAQHTAQFDGELKTITTTVLKLPDGSRYEWFPERPDWQKAEVRRRNA